MTFIIYEESKRMHVSYCMSIASNVDDDDDDDADIVEYSRVYDDKIPARRTNIFCFCCYC